MKVILGSELPYEINAAVLEEILYLDSEFYLHLNKIILKMKKGIF